MGHGGAGTSRQAHVSVGGSVLAAHRRYVRGALASGGRPPRGRGVGCWFPALALIRHLRRGAAVAIVMALGAPQHGVQREAGPVEAPPAVRLTRCLPLSSASIASRSSPSSWPHALARVATRVQRAHEPRRVRLNGSRAATELIRLVSKEQWRSVPWPPRSLLGRRSGTPCRLSRTLAGPAGRRCRQPLGAGWQWPWGAGRRCLQQRRHCALSQPPPATQLRAPSLVASSTTAQCEGKCQHPASASFCQPGALQGGTPLMVIGGQAPS